eukprot:g2708.t1
MHRQALRSRDLRSKRASNVVVVAVLTLCACVPGSMSLEPPTGETQTSNPPADITGIVSTLGDAVKDLNVNIPRLSNLTGVLYDSGTHVKIAAERITGLEAQIQATENQARREFHARVKALAHTFYANLEAQTKPRRDELASLRAELQQNANRLDRNVTEAEVLSDKIRHLKEVQQRGLRTVEAHMARHNLVVLEVGKMTFTYRNPSASPAQGQARRRLEVLWTGSKSPVVIPERRPSERLERPRVLSDVRIDAPHANSFINARQSKLGRRHLWGVVGEAIGNAASAVCESCLETAERGIEATKEVGREGIELTRETVEVPLEVAAAAAREVERVANEAIEYARGAATNAWDALSKAASGLVGVAKEAYDYLGKLENAFTSSVAGVGNFIKLCLSDLSQVPQKLIELADSAGMAVPKWATNILKLMKSTVTAGWHFVQAFIECTSAFTDDPQGTAAGCAEKVLLFLDSAGVELPKWSQNVVIFLKSTSESDNGSGRFQDVWRFLQGLLDTCSTGTGSECVERLLPIAGEFLPLPKWAEGVVDGLRAVETFVATDDGQETLTIVKEGWEKIVVPCVSNISYCAHNFGILQIADNAGLQLPPILHHVAQSLRESEDPLSSAYRLLETVTGIFQSCSLDELPNCVVSMINVATEHLPVPKWIRGMRNALFSIAEGWSELIVPCLENFEFCIENFGILQIAMNSSLEIPPVIMSVGKLVRAFDNNVGTALQNVSSFIIEVVDTCTDVNFGFGNTQSARFSSCADQLLLVAKRVGFSLPEWAEGLVNGLEAVEYFLNTNIGQDWRMVTFHLYNEVIKPALELITDSSTSAESIVEIQMIVKEPAAASGNT